MECAASLKRKFEAEGEDEVVDNSLSAVKKKKSEAFRMLDSELDTVHVNKVQPSSRLRTSQKALLAVVKIFVQTSTPNCSMPWQMKRQRATFGSGFVISGQRILTNAHVVAYQKQVRVRKHGDAKKYTAHLICIGHECDIAMLGVEDDQFWNGVEALEFGSVPQLEEDVVCVGFPTGGDNISVTRGVVSRVDISRYSYSGVDLLAVQIDAAINSGNSGGPALQGDSVIGIAFETLNNAENIGYIIPVPVIEHFLNDFASHDDYMGFCDLGIRWQNLENDSMREYLGLLPDQTGVLVTRVLPTAQVVDVIKKGDVLMSIEDQIIANNGSVYFRGSERIVFRFALMKKYVSDNCCIRVMRNKKLQDVEVKLGTVLPLVPRLLKGKRPSYVVHGGLVFTVLTHMYLSHQWGRDWEEKAPIWLCSHVTHGHIEKPGQQIIILSQILSHELTTGYEVIAFLRLMEFNGKEVLNLEHLAEMLDQVALHCENPDGYMHFLLDRDKEVVLHIRKSFAIASDILSQYAIGQSRSMDLPAPVTPHFL
jgi:S1-C subfamily serine protease